MKVVIILPLSNNLFAFFLTISKHVILINKDTIHVGEKMINSAIK